MFMDIRFQSTSKAQHQKNRCTTTGKTCCLGLDERCGMTCLNGIPETWMGCAGSTLFFLLGVAILSQ
jgi:hypothetical protein